MTVTKVKVFNVFSVLFTVCASYFVYKQGFLGGYFFDDYANLFNLQVFNINNGIEAFLDYVMSFKAGMLKRPLSTLTFLIHANDWPAQAYYFKLFNYMFHLVNAFLLFFVIKYLLIIVGYKKRQIFWTSMLTACLWLFHPFFVSTILYPVQRMTIIPVVFVLLGFIFYSKGRLLMLSNYRKACFLLLISIYICTSLATLSKENGILLPLLLFIYEKIVIQKSNLPKLTNKLRIVLFYLPLFIIITSLLYKLPTFMNFYDSREFSLSQRLLSETRVLTLYLYHLFVPEYFTQGIFTDGFKKSFSLTQPISTLFSVIFVGSLIVISILWRKKIAIISFSILFYFAANIIESTLIPLELYYEHRSYLPSLFIFLPLSLGLVKLSFKKTIFTILPIALLLLVSFNTYIKTNIWSNHLELHKMTVKKFPQSIRAFTMLSSLYVEKRSLFQAIKVLEQAIEYHNNIELYSNYLNLKCFDNSITTKDIESLKDRLLHEKFTMIDVYPFNNFINTIAFSNCNKIAITQVFEFLEIIEKYNPGYKKVPIVRKYHFLNKAMILISNSNYESAYENIISFINLNTDNMVFQIPALLKTIELLIQNKNYNYANKVLEQLKSTFDNEKNPSSVLYRRDYLRYKNLAKESVLKQSE